MYGMGALSAELPANLQGLASGPRAISIPPFALATHVTGIDADLAQISARQQLKDWT